MVASRPETEALHVRGCGVAWLPDVDHSDARGALDRARKRRSATGANDVALGVWLGFLEPTQHRCSPAPPRELHIITFYDDADIDQEDR